MHVLVLYDSRFGNTARVARLVGYAFEPAATVRVMPASELVMLSSEGLDLLVVGGPTQAHGLSPTLKSLLHRLAKGELEGLLAATFDTRFRLPKLLSGSAARLIARRLERAGCRMIAPPQSFFVDRAKPPELEPGEADRVTAWANELEAALALWAA